MLASPRFAIRVKSGQAQPSQGSFPKPGSGNKEIDPVGYTHSLFLIFHSLDSHFEEVRQPPDDISKEKVLTEFIYLRNMDSAMKTIPEMVGISKGASRVGLSYLCETTTGVTDLS